MLTPEQVQQYRQKYSIPAPSASAPASTDRISDMRSRVSAIGGDVPGENGVSMIDELTSRLNKRAEGAAGAVLRYGEGKQTLPETALQVVGQGLGFGADVFVEGVSRGFKAIFNPEQREKMTDLAKDIFLADPEAQMQDVQDMLEWWDKFERENPRTANNIAAAGNVVDFLLNATGVGVAAKGVEGGVSTARKVVGEVAGETAQALERSAARTALDEAEKTARELVMPLETLGQRKKQVGRTVVEGAMSRKVVQPTAMEVRAIQEVASTPGIKPSNLIQENYNILKEANKNEAVRLVADLKANDFVYDKTQLLERLRAAKASLAENPYVTGQGASVASMFKKAEDLIKGSDDMGSAILQLRKDFDAWMEAQKGSKLFTPEIDSAVNAANRSIRDTFNDFLVDMADAMDVPVAIRDSLRRQSAMFRALDNIAPKAAREADTALGRLLQRLQGAMPGNKLVRSMLAAGGLAGIATVSAMAPGLTAATAGGYFVYRLGKLALKPQVRDAMAGVLRAIEKTSMGKGFVSEREVMMDILRHSDDIGEVSPKTRALLMPPAEPGTVRNPFITPAPSEELAMKGRARAIEARDAAAPTQVSFVSPNTQTGLGFADAAAKLRSEEQAVAVRTFNRIDDEAGVIGRTVSAVGDWADGAENTTYFIGRGNDPEAFLYASAKKAREMGQKQFIHFQANPSGPDQLVVMRTGGVDLAKLKEALDKNGVTYKTIGQDQALFFNKSGDFYDNDLIKKLEAAADEVGLDKGGVTVYNGDGDFVGSWLDGEAARADAAKVYDEIINKYENTRGGKAGGAQGGVPSGGPGRADTGSDIPQRNAREAIRADQVAADIQRTIQEKLAQLPEETRRGFLSTETDSPIVKAVIEYAKDPKIGLSIKQVDGAASKTKAYTKETLYHGTSAASADAIRKGGFALDKAGSQHGGFSLLGEGVYLSTDATRAKRFGPDVISVSLKREPKLYKIPDGNYEELYYDAAVAGFEPTNKGIKEYLKSAGYDGAELASRKEIVIIDPSLVKVGTAGDVSRAEVASAPLISWKPSSINPKISERSSPLPDMYEYVHHTTPKALDAIKNNGLVGDERGIFLWERQPLSKENMRSGKTMSYGNMYGGETVRIKPEVVKETLGRRFARSAGPADDEVVNFFGDSIPAENLDYLDRKAGVWRDVTTDKVVSTGDTRIFPNDDIIDKSSLLDDLRSELRDGGPKSKYIKDIEEEVRDSFGIKDKKMSGNELLHSARKLLEEQYASLAGGVRPAEAAALRNVDTH